MLHARLKKEAQTNTPQGKDVENRNAEPPDSLAGKTRPSPMLDNEKKIGRICGDQHREKPSRLEKKQGISRGGSQKEQGEMVQGGTGKRL